MKLAEVVNAMLSRVNLAVSRRSTLNGLMGELHRLRYANDLRASQGPPDSVVASDDILIKHQFALHKEALRHQIATKWEIIDFAIRNSIDQQQIRQCPLCGHAESDNTFSKLETHCIFGGGQLMRHQCPNCDIVFGADKMFQLSSAALAQEYEWHYKAYEEGDSTEQELRAFHLLKPTRDRAYLNYGAGAWSQSVQILRDQGWNVLAFEPHGSASAAGDFVITNRSDLSNMRFDGLFSNNVLEHLRHPVDELAFMRKLLKPAGKMSHATPCFEYLYEFTRFHLFFFLGRSRNLLAEKAGLTVNEFISEGEFMCCILEVASA